MESTLYTHPGEINTCFNEEICEIWAQNHKHVEKFREFSHKQSQGLKVWALALEIPTST